MDERIKKLEIETAYLRKSIEELKTIIQEKQYELHYHFITANLSDKYIEKYGKI